MTTSSDLRDDALKPEDGHIISRSVSDDDPVYEYTEDDCVFEDPEDVAGARYLELGRVRRLQWRLVEQEVDVMLDPLDIPSRSDNPVLFAALGRDNDAAYRQACSKEYVLSIPPLQLQKNAYSFKTIYLNAIRLRESCRERIIATDAELSTIRTRVRRLKSLVAMCEEKIQLGELRCSMYEEEMGRLTVKGTATAPHRFCALLMNTNGYSCVSKCLHKEARRLRAPKDDSMSLNKDNVERDWEESNGIDREFSMREILRSWDLLQVWQLLHGVYVMARYGKKGYPVTLASHGGHRAQADEIDPLINRRGEYGLDREAEESSKGPKAFEGGESQIAELTRDHVGLDSVLRDANAVSDVFTAPLSAAAPGNGIAPWELVCLAVGVSDTANSSRVAELVEARRRQAMDQEGPRLQSNSWISRPEGEQLGENIEALPSSESGPERVFTPNQDTKDNLTLLHKAIIVVAHFLNSALLDIVSSLARNSLNHAINEIMIALGSHAAQAGATSGVTHDMQKVADALLYALSDIGGALEHTLLLRFRTLPQLWIQCLINLRKARVRDEGGKLVNRDDGEVEIATNGAIRKIPLVDDFINSDIIHGSMQRAKAQVVIIRAKELLQEAKAVRDALRGTRSCMCHLRYVLSVPLIQRNVRGYLVRRQYDSRRRMMLFFAMHAAACVIQALARGVEARQRIKEERARRRNAAAVRVQCLVRGFIARCMYLRARRAKAAIERNRASTMMQALARGFLIRRRIANAINAGMAAAKEEEKGWAAVMIQRIARGYVARKTIIKSYHIRNTLSKPVLRLAEQYLVKGDLWKFLSELDGTYKRLYNELEDQKERENRYADTFVKHVINQRKSDFDEVWNQFHNALNFSNGKKARAGSSSLSHMATHTAATTGEAELSATGAEIRAPVLEQIHLRESTEGEGRLISAQSKSAVRRSRKSRGAVTFSNEPRHFGSSSTGDSLYSESSRFPDAAPQRSSRRLELSTGSLAPVPLGVTSTNAVNVPGVLLRRAVASSISAGVKQEMGKLLKSKSRMYKQIDTIKSVYENEEKSLKQHLGTSMSRSSGELRPLKTRQKPNKSVLLSTPRSAQTAGSLDRKGGLEAFHTDWLSASVRDSLPEEKSVLAKDKEVVVEPDKGDSLLVDIPRGVEDKIERLLFAAALRCYVPDFFPHHTAEEAFAVYRRLPHGLAKVRYEHAARQWSQQVVNGLKMKNLIYIKDLLPISKGTIFLHNVDCPSSLVTTAIDMLQKLMKLDPAASGGIVKETKQKTKELLAKESVKVLTYDDAYSNAESAGDESKTVTIDDSANVERAMKVVGSLTRTNRSGMNADSNSKTHLAEPASLAERMLSDIVGSGSWARMEAPVDDLLLHAAFLICGNVPAVSETLSSSTLVSQSRLKSSLIIQLRDGYRGFTRLGLYRKEGADESDGTDPELKDVFGNPKDITLHGHDAFIDFGYYLEHLQLAGAERGDSNEVIVLSLRNAVRDRYKTALLMSTPFELHLKASGVTNVAQLIRCDLGQLDLPLLYRVQIESMLSTVVAKSIDAKELPNLSAAPDGEMAQHMTNQIAFKVPLVYDSRFQRGPLDPYGKPPRLTSQANTSLTAASGSPHRSPHGPIHKRSRNPKQALLESEENDSDLPKGLWKSEEFDGSDGLRVRKRLHAKASLPSIIREKRELNERLGTYDRPYVCSKPGCGQAFSRLYALRMHERTHAAAFAAYEEYRAAPQYLLDPTAAEQAEADARRETRLAALPDFVLAQLEAIQTVQ